MKKMQCEVCGSTDIKKIDDSIFECQSCGVQYSKDEVQKLLVEITGSVKIDRSEEIENAFKRAVGRLLKNGYIERVRRDLYAAISVETKQPVLSRYQIGSRLAADAYLSHHSAF